MLEHFFGDHRLHVYDPENDAFVPVKSTHSSVSRPYVLFEELRDMHNSKTVLYTFFTPDGKEYARIFGYKAKDSVPEINRKLDEAGKLTKKLFGCSAINNSLNI